MLGALEVTDETCLERKGGGKEGREERGKGEEKGERNEGREWRRERREGRGRGGERREIMMLKKLNEATFHKVFKVKMLLILALYLQI